MKVEQELQAILARCEAATEGPWERAEKSVRVIGSQVDMWYGKAAPNGFGGGICNCLGGGYPSKRGDAVNVQARANAEFIAHARSDLPATVIELQQLRRWIREGVEDNEQDDWPMSAMASAVGYRIRNLRLEHENVELRDKIKALEDRIEALVTGECPV